MIFLYSETMFGEMLEWLKRHAWKACKRQKRFGGSNPPLSAQGRGATNSDKPQELTQPIKINRTLTNQPNSTDQASTA